MSEKDRAEIAEKRADSFKKIISSLEAERDRLRDLFDISDRQANQSLKEISRLKADTNILIKDLEKTRCERSDNAKDRDAWKAKADKMREALILVEANTNIKPKGECLGADYANEIAKAALEEMGK